MLYIDKPFQYINDIINTWRVGDKVNAIGINELTARFTGKTFNWKIGSIKACLVLEPGAIRVYYIRLMGAKIAEERQGFFDILNKENIPFKYANNIFTVNGNQIILKSIHSNSKQVINVAGLPPIPDMCYGLVIIDEFYEFNEDEWALTNQAIRGSINKQILIVRISNPWLLLHWWVAKCNSQVLLPTEKNSHIFKKKNRWYYHYGNSHINNFLSQKEIDTIDDLCSNDPARARVVVWGMGGVFGATVFGNYLPFIFKKPLWSLDESDSFSGGLDVGDTNHPTTAVFWCKKNKFIFKEDEYWYDPTKGFQDSEQLAMSIINFFNRKMNELKIDYLDVYVDYGAFTYINNLNAKAYDAGLTGLSFMRCKKPPIKDRVDLYQAMMSYKFIGWNEKCKMTYETYPLIQWDENKKSYSPNILDAYDDSFDADVYATVDWCRELVRQSNLVLQKGNYYARVH